MAGEEATVTVVVKVGTDIAGWKIAKDNGEETPLQITPQLSFKLPAPIKNGNGKGKGNVSNSAIETMTLTLKCGTTVNSSITISSN